jgi:hypothetical protein
MATTLISEQHGVRLEWVDNGREQASGTGGPHYRIRSLRPVQPIVRADKGEAEACFAREVAASRLDPVVAMILEREE